jgi:hypothetical protein
MALPVAAATTRSRVKVRVIIIVRHDGAIYAV